jgi:hypothetical protein
VLPRAQPWERAGEVFHKDDDYAAFLKLLPQSSERLPMVLRYVERNAVRAKSIPVRKAPRWPWSSLGSRPKDVRQSWPCPSPQQLAGVGQRTANGRGTCCVTRLCLPGHALRKQALAKR